MRPRLSEWTDEIDVVQPCRWAQIPRLAMWHYELIERRFHLEKHFVLLRSFDSIKITQQREDGSARKTLPDEPRCIDNHSRIHVIKSGCPSLSPPSPFRPVFFPRLSFWSIAPVPLVCCPCLLFVHGVPSFPSIQLRCLKHDVGLCYTVFEYSFEPSPSLTNSYIHLHLSYKTFWQGIARVLGMDWISKVCGPLVIPLWVRRHWRRMRCSCGQMKRC